MDNNKNIYFEKMYTNKIVLNTWKCLPMIKERNRKWGDKWISKWTNEEKDISVINDNNVHWSYENN